MSKLNFFKPTTASANTIEVFLLDEFFNAHPDLVRGGTYSHVFNLPFLCSELIESFEIMYSQGKTTILTGKLTNLQDKSPISTGVHSDLVEDLVLRTCYITFTLQPEETILFEKSLQDAYCQIKFNTLDGRVLFSTPQKLNVVSSLFSQSN